jgi:hypothetical protein
MFHMPFKEEHQPPTVPIEVRCVNCGAVFDSSQMSWMELEVRDGRSSGCWKCPTPNCMGTDFGQSIHPTDPTYVDEFGRDVVWRDENGTPSSPRSWIEELGEDACNPCSPEEDSFRPPRENTEVVCLHCGQKYDSYRIEWREFEKEDGTKQGFWCCPIEGCDGKGFCFDIYPTDPNYPEYEDGRHLGGWFDDDGNRVPRRPGRRTSQPSLCGVAARARTAASMRSRSSNSSPIVFLGVFTWHLQSPAPRLRASPGRSPRTADQVGARLQTRSRGQSRLQQELRARPGEPPEHRHVFD